jgi:hypothetical protein
LLLLVDAFEDIKPSAASILGGHELPQLFSLTNSYPNCLKMDQIEAALADLR